MNDDQVPSRAGNDSTPNKKGSASERPTETAEFTELSFLKRNRDRLAAIGVFLVTSVLTVLSFPPFNTSEFAYAFAAPAVFWAYLRPSFRLYAGTLLAAQAVAWCVILGWLHHVTWVGLLLLGPFVGAWIGLWYLAVWWAMPRMWTRRPLQRILVILGLAGLWALIEWTRGWVLGGFPWLPLAASQWQRSIVLQVASLTGSAGVSFLLILFNLGIAAYAHRLLRQSHQGLRKRCPEFMFALMLLIFPAFLMLGDTFRQQRVDVARLALVQPHIPQEIKWEPAHGTEIAATLEALTLEAARQWPDAILWPEAVTPWAVQGEPRARDFVSTLALRARVPLVLGSIAIEEADRADEAWFNAVLIATPEGGVSPSFYAKRRLVPFGEYVPLRPLLGWLSKVVPVGDDFARGHDPHPLILPMQRGIAVLGPLICYEDTYPQLARASVRSGAEILTVHTNNGWFGEDGAAVQHAAHAVLRAIETRRPLVRVGNSGWSGWIDEFGNVREMMADAEGSIYYRGVKTISVSRDMRWADRQSVYVRYGDWFVLMSAVLASAAGALLRLSAPPTEPSDL
ncbi:acyltransferase [Cephaloticoccus capnophilus]|uniref:Apolipoprotein N-acyltransferase n=1 Tax=Cephaloticoccus capnophilus TaxID=1548208 RepID=A0A139SN90_9BACT|nr:apolipoprotein N-acyltransferase [Cephaloticoccus capnophilus]KXU36093.1 acyltransferase [Cephaloticoccus capnophilus]